MSVNTEQQKQQAASKLWENLRQDIIRRIDEIDQLTPYQEYEPNWWLNMMDVRKFAEMEVNHGHNTQPNLAS